MNINSISHQLSEFSALLSGDAFKYLSIKTNFDLNDYIIYYTLKDTQAVKERMEFRRACNRNSNPFQDYDQYANFFKEIVYKNTINSNLSKLDSIIDFRKNFYDTLFKELDVIFKDFNLLSYKILTPSMHPTSLKGIDDFLNSDFTSTLDLDNRRIIANLRVFPKDESTKTKISNFIDCTLYIECI